nr:MAG TPA: hypothetical protein [Caudoviricetes sp.]
MYAIWYKGFNYNYTSIVYLVKKLTSHVIILELYQKARTAQINEF